MGLFCLLGHKWDSCVCVRCGKIKHSFEHDWCRICRINRETGTIYNIFGYDIDRYNKYGWNRDSLNLVINCVINHYLLSTTKRLLFQRPIFIL